MDNQIGTDRQTDRHTDRQTDRQTGRHRRVLAKAAYMAKGDNSG